MKEYAGYAIKNEPLRYEISYGGRKTKLPVYATEDKIRKCSCGSKLALLYYDAKIGGYGREIHGKKCPECGKNYFSYKSCALHGDAFEIIETYIPMSENIVAGTTKELFVDPGTYIYVEREGFQHECEGKMQTRRISAKLLDSNGCMTSVTMRYCSFCKKYYINGEKQKNVAHRFNKYKFIELCEEENVAICETSLNIFERNNVNTDIEDINLNTMDEYYMINREETICRACGGILEKSHQRVTIGGKRRSMSIRTCLSCNFKHISYGTYAMHGYGKIVNSEEIDYMQRVSELRHEIKIRKKELDKLERNFDALLALGKVPIYQGKVKEKRDNNIVVDVYFKLNNYCIRKNHKIQTVTMPVTNIRGYDTKEVNVFYCEQCDKYWINYEAIEELIKKQFYPNFKYRVVNESWEGLKPASELMLYGYNVKEGDLSKERRQNLLKYLIDNNLMSKQKIIRNIETKVEFNGKKRGNENAKRRWQEDIKYVSEYTSDNEKIIHAQIHNI